MGLDKFISTIFTFLRHFQHLITSEQDGGNANS